MRRAFEQPAQYDITHDGHRGDDAEGHEHPQPEFTHLRRLRKVDAYDAVSFCPVSHKQ
jgi:hypothetical protein